MNEKNNDSNSQDDSFSDSMELFDDIFDEGKEVDQKPAPQKELSAGKPVSPSSDSENGAFSDSMELFDDIFQDGTDADKPAPPSKKTRPARPQKTRKGPEPQKGQVMQKPRPPASPPKKAPPVKPQPPAPTPDRTSPPRPVKKTQKGPEPQKGPPVPPTEKVPTVPLGLSGERKRSQGKAKKGVNPLVFISSIVILVIVSMLTGMILDYGGMFDPLKITRFFEPDKKITNRSKISSPATKHEKPEIENSNVQGAPPTTEGTPPVISNVSAKKLPVVTDIEEVRPTEVIHEDKAATTSAAPPPPERSVADDSDILKTETLSYPYSIYLGSYGTEASVKEAVSDYEEMGLSPYWVELDLGDKGTWFRLFAGYFQKRAEADEFIKNQPIPGAESKNTKYVNLVGIFTSKEGLDIQKEKLERLGYSPYVISDTPNVYRLYIGAFYQKQRAEEQGVELSLKGIKCQVVER